MSDREHTGSHAAVPAEGAARQERRVRRGRTSRRFDATVLVAVVLVLAAAAALWLTRPEGWSEPKQAAREAALRSATLICPAALRGKDAVGVATTATKAAGGEAALTGKGAAADSVSLAPGKVTPAEADKDGLVISAVGNASAGLVAGRSSRRPLAATECRPPAGEEWFTGLGAGPVHNSTIELTNPNKGSGVVDITVLDKNGVVDIADLRGVAVPGGSSRTIDLQKLMSRTGSLAIHTSVVRGQVAVAVRDRSGQLVASSGSEEWLAPQGAPRTSNLLLGYPKHATSQSLVIANPGDNQVTASLKLVTPDAVISPQGAPDVQIPPHTVATVALNGLLDKPVAEDAYGIELDASGPVTTTLRSVAHGDLAVTAPAGPVSVASALVVPAGKGVTHKTVDLAGASGVGAAMVVSRDADGKQLDSTRVALKQQQGATVDVPAAAALVEVRPDRVSVSAALLVRGDGDAGAAVLPFREVAVSARVPAVAPGLR